MPTKSAWTLFRIAHRGKGYTPAQMSAKYRATNTKKTITKKTTVKKTTVKKPKRGVCPNYESKHECYYNPNCTWVKSTQRCRGKSGTTAKTTVYQGPILQ